MLKSTYCTCTSLFTVVQIRVRLKTILSDGLNRPSYVFCVINTIAYTSCLSCDFNNYCCKKNFNKKLFITRKLTRDIEAGMISKVVRTGTDLSHGRLIKLWFIKLAICTTGMRYNIICPLFMQAYKMVYMHIKV